MSSSLAPHLCDVADAIAAFALLDAVGDVWVSTVPIVAYDPATGGARLAYETAVRVAYTNHGYEPAPRRYATRDEATHLHQAVVRRLRDGDESDGLEPAIGRWLTDVLVVEGGAA